MFAQSICFLFALFLKAWYNTIATDESENSSIIIFEKRICFLQRIHIFSCEIYTLSE